MSRKLSRNTRRAIVASLLGLTVGGGVLASAASLSVTGNTLGAGTVVIASCDTDGVTLKYTHSYLAGTGAGQGQYRTSAVAVTGVATACVGKSISVTLKDSTGASLGNGTLSAIPAVVAPATEPAVSISFTTPFIDANAVVGAAVVIAD
jgi:hypothetical protein